MISLAPLRYARILLKHYGPIERLEYGRVQVGEETLYQANASLSSHLNLQRPALRIFGDADGTGTHQAAILARHKAISEAIERWAVYYLNQVGMTQLHGLAEDPSTTGVAAYPGLVARQARERAYAEAVERFCLVGWWEGDLRSRDLGLPRKDLEAIEIENPLSGHRVVVVWQKCRRGFYAYGFSGSRRLSEALWKAEVEMARATDALSGYFRDNPGFVMDDLSTVDHILERRVLYFSQPEGHREFRTRIESSAKSTEWRRLKPLVDGEIPGPWSRYATVWRVLFPMPTRAYLNRHSSFFYW